MKKIIIILCLFALICSPAVAFLYEVKNLSKDEIQELKNEEILEVYISTVIERKASEAFHGRAGFTPKEYNKFKDLLGLIVKLRQEMLTRQMDVPPIEEWLK